MDASCCFNNLATAGVPFQNHPVLICPPPVLSCSTSKVSFSPLVAVSTGARREDTNADGGVLSMTQLMFRNLAALLYRNVPRGKPKAEPAGSSWRLPSPESDSDSDKESEGGEEAAEEGEEGERISEEMAEELECLEEEAIAGSWEGREPGDYERRAHLFDESSRVFQALKERRRNPSSATRRIMTPAI